MPILVESDVSEDWDPGVEWSGIARLAAQAAVDWSRHGVLEWSRAGIEISVRLTDDEEVRSLNARFRNKDKATNVLSFPMIEPEALEDVERLADREEVLLGDLVVAHGVCATEAAEKGIPIPDHLAHLVVHGTLHLLGYDHETSEADAEAMEEIERKALASLGIADPYQVTEVES